MIVVWYGCDGIDGAALIKAIASHELSHNTGCIGNEYLWCNQKDATKRLYWLGTIMTEKVYT